MLTSKQTLLPDTVESEDIRFTIGNKTDREKKTVSSDGQIIDLPSGNYKMLYLLAAATADVKANFVIDNQTTRFNIQKCTGYVDQF